MTGAGWVLTLPGPTGSQKKRLPPIRSQNSADIPASAAKCATAPTRGSTWYLKVYRYRLRRPRRLLTFLYRKSRARTEYESLVHLRSHGVAAVEPVAYGSHRIGPFMRSCFLLTRGVEGIEGDRYLEEFFARTRTEAWHQRRLRLLYVVSDLVARMHSSDLFHYDLKFRNIVVAESEGADYQVHLLDFPKGEVIPQRRRAARHGALVWDLACLDKYAPSYFSRSDRMRWFVRYLGRSVDARSRPLLREIEALRGRMRRKSAAAAARR